MVTTLTCVYHLLHQSTYLKAMSIVLGVHVYDTSLNILIEWLALLVNGSDAFPDMASWVVTFLCFRDKTTYLECWFLTVW